MQWFLLRQDADGSRVDVAEYESQEAANEALVSYQYHHPQYAPYFVEAREAPPAPPGPKFVAPPLAPTVRGPQVQSLPQPAPTTKSSSMPLYAAVGAALVVVALATFFLLNRSGDDDVANDASPGPSEVERVTPRETPTSLDAEESSPQPDVLEDPGPAPTSAPTPLPPLTPIPTPTPEEVTLTQGAGALEQIRARGILNCGISISFEPFSATDPSGAATGFDADMCRAVAVAILGDRDAVNFVPLSAAQRFTELRAGTVDLLMRNSTWTQGRDTDLGVDFGPTTYFDGQQLMGRASDGFSADSQLGDIDGAVVCVIAGTTTELRTIEGAEAAGVDIDLQTFEDFLSLNDAFASGACDLVTTDGSLLASRRLESQPLDQDWVIFPRVPLSKEPLGPIYRQDDSQFADIVNWTIYAMLTADEYDINSTNVVAVAVDPPNGEVDRLLGGSGELQTLMSLEPDAYGQVIRQVGSYSEVYNRHLAPAGLPLEGSLNDLWLNGGLMYPPPMR